MSASSTNSIVGRMGLDLAPLSEAAHNAIKIVDAMADKMSDHLKHTALKLGTLMGIGLGIEHFIEATHRVVEFGAHLEELEAQTGVSVKALVELQEAFTDGGLSIEVMGRSVMMLSRRLNSQKGLETFQKLGADIDTLKRMRPEDMFVAIGRRINSIADPMERLQTAVALFGGQGRRLLSVFKEESFGKPSAGIKHQAEIIAKNAHVFKEVTDKLNHLLNVGRGFFLGVAEAVIPAINHMGAVLEKIDLVSAGQVFGRFLRDAGSVVLAAMHSVYEIAMGVREIFAIVGESLMATFRVITGQSSLTLSNVSKTTQAHLKSVLGVIKEASKTLLMLPELFGDLLKLALFESLDLLSTGFANIVTAFGAGLATNFAGVSSDWHDLIEWVSDTLAEAWYQISDGQSELWTWIVDTVAGIGKALYDSVVAVGSALIDIAGMWTHYLFGGIQTFLDYFRTGILSIAAMFGAAISHAFAKVLSIYPDRFLKFMGINPKELNKTYAERVADAGSALGLDKGRSDLGDSAKAHMAAGDALFNKIGDRGLGMTDAVMNVAHKIPAFLSKASASIQKAGSHAWDAITGAVDHVADALADQFAGKSWLTGPIEETKARIKETLTELLKKGHEAFEHLFHPVEEATKKAGGGRRVLSNYEYMQSWRTLGGYDRHAAHHAPVSFMRKYGETPQQFEARKAKARGQDAKKHGVQEEMRDCLKNIQESTQETADAWSDHS